MSSSLPVLVQALYEIAMSIGTTLELEPMLRHFLSTTLRKLNCSAGAILAWEQRPRQPAEKLRSVLAIPRRIESNPVYRQALQSLPAEERAGGLDAFSPLTGRCGDTCFHLLSLPGYGVLVLIKSGEDLQEGVVASLAPLLRKLANICIEITRRHRAEGRLKESERRLSTLLLQKEVLITELASKNEELELFAHSISHDLKSPLITIMGYLGMLEDSARKGDTLQLQEDIQRISRAADRMSILLDDLLDLTRIGRKESTRVPVSLVTLARDAVELVAGRIADRDVEVVVSPDLPVVLGDPTLLRKVMQNLLDNSVKFMGDQQEPRVEISGDSRNGRPVLHVRDNGVGIAPAYLERVFDLFLQLDPGSGGTGAGLTLVKRIVESHGGRIWVESPGLGCGTTFSVQLPSPQAPE